MFVTTTRNALFAFALLLTFLWPAARPAHAQTLTRSEVRKLIKIYSAQARILVRQIGRDQLLAARFPNSIAQTALSTNQSALALIQSDISKLEQLLADLNLAFAIDGEIQRIQKQGLGNGEGRHHDCDDDDDDHHHHHHGHNGGSKLLKAFARQAVIVDLQAALAQVQADISKLQSEILD